MVLIKVAQRFMGDKIKAKITEVSVQLLQLSTTPHSKTVCYLREDYLPQIEVRVVNNIQQSDLSSFERSGTNFTVYLLTVKYRTQWNSTFIR